MKRLLTTISVMALLISGAQADPGHVKLAWDANDTTQPGQQLNTYRLWYGLKSNSDPTFTAYDQFIDVPHAPVDYQGLQTILYKLKLTAGATYFSAVTAINTLQVESAYSNEITFVMTQKPKNFRIR